MIFAVAECKNLNMRFSILQTRRKEGRVVIFPFYIFDKEYLNKSNLKICSYT